MMGQMQLALVVAVQPQVALALVIGTSAVVALVGGFLAARRRR